MSPDVIGLLLVALRLTAIACLYIFLGLVTLTLYKSLKITTPKEEHHPAITLLFHIKDINKAKHFSKTPIIIGRSTTSDCIINNETISSKHALLSFHHNQWWLEDLESKNGTFLNEHHLTTPAVLTNNDQVTCGEISFTVFIQD
jgi:hypothetical protein